MAVSLIAFVLLLRCLMHAAPSASLPRRDQQAESRAHEKVGSDAVVRSSKAATRRYSPAGPRHLLRYTTWGSWWRMPKAARSRRPA